MVGPSVTSVYCSTVPSRGIGTLIRVSAPLLRLTFGIFFIMALVSSPRRKIICAVRCPMEFLCTSTKACSRSLYAFDL